MVDPLTEVVTLLRPSAAFSKVVNAAGAWRARRTEAGRPFYCVLLAGATRLTVDKHAPIDLRSGDFVLVPSAYQFTMSSIEPLSIDSPDSRPTRLSCGEYRLGVQEGDADVRLLVGYCAFGSPDATLLVSLLPQLVHVRDEPRLATLVQLVGEESRTARPARDVILTRLLEVLLIEALRSTAGIAASSGLARGLADERLGMAIRCMHEQPDKPWTIAQLAREAALSRSVFFERFTRAVGIAPMEYLLSWRMALAKDLLRRNAGSVASIAERTGYSSASTFGIAFTRHVGVPPSRYARELSGQ